MSSANERSRFRKFSDSMVGLLAYKSLMRTSPRMMPATSLPYSRSTDSRVQSPYFTDSWSMIPRMEARRMPISSATIMAVCISLMMGFIPKTLRGMLPPCMAFTRWAFSFRQSSFWSVSLDNCSSLLYSVMSCSCSCGVKKVFPSIILKIFFVGKDTFFIGF